MAEQLDLKVVLSANAAALQEALRETNAALKSIDQSGKDAAKSSKLLGDGLAAVKSALTFSLATAGIAGLGAAITGAARAAVDTTVKFDRINAVLKAVSGSTEAASRDFEFIRDVSKRLGLELVSTADAYGKLAAAAKGTELAGEPTRQIFTAIANAAARLGLSADEMSGALLAISQMMSKGTVQAEELRGQLGERLPGAFQIAARAMGVTTAELSKMLEQGQVITTDFLPKFARELNNSFGTGGQIDTAQANVNRLSTAWEEFKKAFTNTDFVNSTIKAITEGIEDITEQLKETRTVIYDLSKPVRVPLTMQERPAPRPAPQPIPESLITDAIRQRQQLDPFLAPRGGVFTFGRQSAAFAARPIDDATKKQIEKDAKAEAEATEQLTRSKIELLRAQQQHNEALRLEAELRGLSGEQAEQYIQTELEILRIRESKADQKADTRAAAAAKRQSEKDLADRRQILEAELSQEQDINTRAEQQLTASYQRRRISIEAFFSQVAEIRRRDVDEQIATREAELQLTSDRGEQARILAEINNLTRERESIGPQVAQDQADAEKELADQLEQVRLRLAELTGTEAEKRQAQTDQLRARYKELIEALKAQGDTAGIELVDKLINAEAARDKFDELSEFGKQAARNIQSAFADFLFDPFDEGLEGMAEGFANTLRRMIAEATSRQLVEALFGQFKNASSGDSTGFTGFLASIFSFHSGGIVGQGGATRFVPSLAFAGAPRLHSGGWILPGEVPAILKQGEEVLTEDDPRHIKNFRGGPAVEVHIHEAPGTQARTEAKQESGKVQLDIMIEQIEQRLGANINRGGGLAPTLERRYGLNRAAGAVS